MDQESGTKEKSQSEAVRRYLLAREARRLAPPALLTPPPALAADTLWRGLAREGELRLLVARAGVTVDAVARAQGANPTSRALLGELLVGAQLVRATLNPEESLQLTGTQMGGVGNFVVDVFADGGARATLRQPAPDGWALTGGTLTVTRQRRGGARYQSSVAFAAGARPTEVLMRYLVESEQIVSLLDVSLGEGAQASAAVGYLVQLMPEGSRDDLARLVENLATTGPLQVGMTTDDPDAIGWAGRLLAGVHWDQVARQEVAFRCPCSAERVLALLASLPRADLAELVEGLEAIETRCDYCGQSWTTPVEQIQPLLDPPS